MRRVEKPDKLILAMAWTTLVILAPLWLPVWWIGQIVEGVLWAFKTVNWRERRWE